MTVMEFWGAALIAFGPPLAMFSMTVAEDPIKVILLISSAFFWLISFLVVAILWSFISTFCNYLIVGAYLAVLSQEVFRLLFHNVTKKAQFYLSKIIQSEVEDTRTQSSGQSQRFNEIQIRPETIEFKGRIPLSYVSGLGFGLMSAAFSLMNVLTDYLGPGTVGLRGDSPHFLLVSSITALAFILLNVSWSVLMSESIEKDDKRLGGIVLITHLVATTVTLANRVGLQLLSILTLYAMTFVCGCGAFQVAGVDVKGALIPSFIFGRA